MSMYNHILVAVDLGDNSAAVLRQAAALASLCEATLTVLHVVDFVPSTDTDSLVERDDLRLKVDTDLAQQRMNQLLTEALPGGSAELLVVAGRPKVEILRTAIQEGANLVVMGAHGRHGLQGLLGSTTDRVLQQSTCDVLTVRV